MTQTIAASRTAKPPLSYPGPDVPDLGYKVVPVPEAAQAA